MWRLGLRLEIGVKKVRIIEVLLLNETGSVSAPRIEIANEDLVRAHVYAIWLACSGLSLQSNMTQILQAEGGSPSLELQP